MGDSSTARQRAAATKQERSRKAIIESATQLFTEQGWLPTTVEAIASGAGVGTATVYKHFTNKNVIAGLVFRPIVADLLADSRWSDEQVDTTEALRGFVHDLTTCVRTNTPLTIALLEAVNDSTARRGARITPEDPRYYVPIPPLLTAIIKRGQSSGTFLSYPAAEDAGPLLSNLLMLYTLTRPNESIADSARLLFTIAARTLGLTETYD